MNYLLKLESWRSLAVLATAALSLAISPWAHAQASGTGIVTGRVFNPATGEYVRNAEVSVQGTNITAISETGGVYQLDNVPAGEPMITVKYSGYDLAVAKVRVSAGQSVAQDFEIKSTVKEGAGDTVKLAEFVVATEREGNSKAIMQQRNSMNVSRAIASDVFGDVTEGNVGEFLKYLPGVELEYVEADTRGPRLGGMAPEYTGVTIDGAKLASADAFVQYGSTENGSTGSGTRSFGFEQVSINSIESIEINRVVSADMSADGAAGNINLKMKRAFDRKGRRIDWNVGTTFNSEHLTLKKVQGPNDSSGRKFRQNYSFNYSDVFFRNRLGILLGISESNLFAKQYRIDSTVNRQTTAADPRSQVITSLNFKDGPKWTNRFSATMTADFKATSELSLSLGMTFNQYDGRFYNRTVAFTAATNNTAATTGRQFVTGDGFLSYGTQDLTTNATARTVALGGGNGIKLTNTFTVLPKFEYKRGSFTVDGGMSFSGSKNDYDNLVRGTALNTAANNLTNIGFNATRSEPGKADWRIVQTSGVDWANPANYTNTRLTDDGRFARNEVWSGNLNAKYVTPLSIPTYLKVGGSWEERRYITDQYSPLYSWSYVGPGGNTRDPVTGVITANGTYTGELLSPYIFDMGQTGGGFTSITGGGPPRFGNRDNMAQIYKAHPEFFVNAATADNYATAKFLNHRDYTETVSAAYVMGNSRVGRWQFQGGVRFEETEKSAKEFQPITNAAVRLAGFPVANVNVTDPVTGVVTAQPLGNPTTNAGVEYKYTSKPRITKTDVYHNYFPSITAKFRWSENLIADLGYGKTIRRPDINRLSGVAQINEVAQTITLPNPFLDPELSEKYVAALGYYFGRNGSSNVQILLSHTKAKNSTRDSDLTSDQFGNTDPNFAGYTFVTGSSIGPPITWRSMELSYSQQLTFLPDVLRGTSVFAGYTRTYATERIGGLTPHTVKAGINYRYKRVSFGFNGVWLDEAPWTNTVGRFRPNNAKFDVTAGVRLTRNTSVYFAGRNIFETPHRIFDEIGGTGRILTRLENYGSNWSIGVKGNF